MRKDLFINYLRKLLDTLELKEDTYYKVKIIVSFHGDEVEIHDNSMIEIKEDEDANDIQGTQEQG